MLFEKSNKRSWYWIICPDDSISAPFWCTYLKKRRWPFDKLWFPVEDYGRKEYYNILGVRKAMRKGSWLFLFIFIMDSRYCVELYKKFVIYSIRTLFFYCIYRNNEVKYIGTYNLIFFLISDYDKDIISEMRCKILVAWELYYNENWATVQKKKYQQIPTFSGIWYCTVIYIYIA